MGAVDQSDFEIERTYALLGGPSGERQPVRNSMDAHELLLSGIPAATLVAFLTRFEILSTGDVLEKALGISLRTLQRRKTAVGQDRLSTEQSNRIWKFAEIVGHATEVFGSLDAAEVWLTSPALGLDQRKPIDLLATAVGIEAVERYLTQIEYGVYA